MPNSSEHHRESLSPDEPESINSSFAVRTLVTIAERRKGVDAARCRLALLHLDSALLIHRNLREVLARYQLSDLQFTVLVVLFSTEPEPLSASVLAEHAGVSRSAITEALDKLSAAQLLTRTRDDFDRRVTYVRISPNGQEIVDRAINDYLRAAEEAVGDVRPSAQRVLLSAYLDLLRTLSKGHRPAGAAIL